MTGKNTRRGPARILIVEDDDETAQLLSRFLRGSGYTVAVANDSRAADMLLQQGGVDLALFDIMLPGESGLTLCRRYIATGLRVIMVTALSELSDKVAGLDVGADDYIAKPFDLDELGARVRSVLRRQSVGDVAGQFADMILSFAQWRFYPNKRYLRSPDNVRVPLTGAETDLLLAFCQHPQELLTREQLIAWTRGEAVVVPDRTIDLLVSRLRRKLSLRGVPSDAIHTARTGGYMLRHPVTATVS